MEVPEFLKEIATPFGSIPGIEAVAWCGLALVLRSFSEGGSEAALHENGQESADSNYFAPHLRKLAPRRVNRAFPS